MPEPGVPPPPPPPRARGHGRPDGFVGVLGLLGVCYMLSAVTSARWARVVVTVVYVVALVVTVRATDPSLARRRLLRGVVVCCGLVAVVSLAVLPSDAADGVLDLMATAVLALTLVLVLDRVLRHPTVTVQTIAGALSAYLLIGMTFTSLYAVIAWLGPAPFFGSGAPHGPPALQYFSFTTLTTLGYGDLTVVSDVARAVATLEALVGQIFLATLVASLVTTFRAQGRDADRPAGG